MVKVQAMFSIAYATGMWYHVHISARPERLLRDLPEPAHHRTQSSHPSHHNARKCTSNSATIPSKPRSYYSPSLGPPGSHTAPAATQSSPAGYYHPSNPASRPAHPPHYPPASSGPKAAKPRPRSRQSAPRPRSRLPPRRRYSYCSSRGYCRSRLHFAARG